MTNSEMTPAKVAEDEVLALEQTIGQNRERVLQELGIDVTALTRL